MKVDTASEKTNVHLKRKEINLLIEHTGEPTPTKAALQQLLAKQLNKAVEHIDIVNIFSDKGRPQAKSSVYLWEEAKAQDLSKVVKKKGAEAAAETQAAPAQAAAPAPAEKK